MDDDDAEEDVEYKSHDREVVGRACAELMKHFDSVQIFVTRYDAGTDSTVAAALGRGNWYTRLGQLHSWLIRQEAATAEEEHEDF